MKATVLRCDYHEGVDAVETVPFTLGGTAYEIDVCGDCRAEMKAAGRKVTKPAGRNARARRRRVVPAEVRAWAHEHGVPVGRAGTIPKAVVEQFEMAAANGSK